MLNNEEPKYVHKICVMRFVGKES